MLTRPWKIAIGGLGATLLLVLIAAWLSLQATGRVVSEAVPALFTEFEGTVAENTSLAPEGSVLLSNAGDTIGIVLEIARLKLPQRSDTAVIVSAKSGHETWRPEREPIFGRATIDSRGAWIVQIVPDTVGADLVGVIVEHQADAKR